MKNLTFLTVRQAKILVVDDRLENLELLAKMLGKQEHEVHCVGSGEKALEIARSGWAEIILLDIQMPNMNGYEVCQQLKTHPKTQNIPVIFLSALDEPMDKIKAFQVGGIDYITKPFQYKEVLIRVDNQLKIQKTQNTVRSLNKQLEEKIHKRNTELELVNQKLIKEIKQRQEAQDKLLKLALNDSLTGLPNRNAFLGELKQLLGKERTTSQEKATVLLVSCNLVLSKNRKVTFPEIKCYLDHLALNQLFIMVAHRLQTCLPSSATLSRFEGNNFAILLKNITKGQQEVMAYIKVINQQFKQPFNIAYKISNNRDKKEQLTIACNIGVVLIDKDCVASHDILHNAEIAIYQAQKRQNLNYYFFTPEKSNLQKSSRQVVEINKSIKTNTVVSNNNSKSVSVVKKLKEHFKEAFKKRKITLHYQPIFSLNNANNLEPQGLEVVDAWNSYRKDLSIQKFFKDVDGSKLDIYFKNFTLDYACYYLKKIQKQHETQQNFFLTMPFTTESLLQPQFILKIKQILTKIELKPHNLHIDVVGNHATLSNQQILTLIKELSQLGIVLNLEYFDLPYETLKKISQLPFHNFKISSSMTAQITNQKKEENSQIAIAKAINVAHTHEISVTAKGITTQDQLDYLKSVGCNYGQGNLLSEPLDMESLETFLVWRL